MYSLRGRIFSNSQWYFSQIDFWFVLLAFFLPFLLSLPLVSSDLMSGEYAEMVLSVTTLGIAQFPGFPLYFLACKLVTLLLPLGTEIWKINFASLLFGALASLVVYLTGRRLRFPPLVSLASALLLFLSTKFWTSSLLSQPEAFHSLLLCLTVYMTLSIIGPFRWKHPRTRIFIWALVCSATGTQHFVLLPWAIAALVLGLALGLPRHRAQARGSWYPFILAGILLGLLLPYLYLPLRVLSPAAFVNIDFLSPFAHLRQEPTFSRLVTWLIHYVSHGFDTYFLGYDFRSTLPELGRALLSFIRTYPFFPLIMVIWGLLLSLRRLFLKQIERPGQEADNASRITLAMLPLLALGGEAVLLPEHESTAVFTLLIGAAYWSLTGLEYCFHTLGHADDQLARAQRLKPSWFALLIILLVPVFTFLHSYPALRAVVPRADNSQPNLTRWREFMEPLPAESILVFPRAGQSFVPVYLQMRTNLRPDLALQPFSRPWQTSPYAPPSLLSTLDAQPKHRRQYRLAFIRYWNHDLSKKIVAGRPAFLLTNPLPATPAMDYFLQTFDLSDAYTPVTEQHQPGAAHVLSVYRIRKPLPPQPSRRESLARTFLGELGGELRLLTAQIKRPVKRWARFSILKIELKWQVLRPPWSDKRLVRFWVTPADSSKTSSSGIVPRPWRATRRLGSGRWLTRLKPRQAFSEYYQLAVPVELPVGRYQVQVAVLDEDGRWLDREDQGPGEKNYFFPACEFWVVDAESRVVE